MYWLGIVTGVVSGLAYLGYKYRSKLIQSNFVINLLTKTIANEELGQFTEGDGHFAIVHYKRRGRDYNVYIPYERKQISKMSGKRVLLYKGESVIDVTQQPGVKYLLRAEQMNGDHFSIVGEEGEHKLERERIPFVN